MYINQTFTQCYGVTFIAVNLTLRHPTLDPAIRILRFAQLKTRSKLLN
jgi:hypothetical protein